MSGVSKPVWVWLPDQPEPTRAGTFTLESGLGRFTYDASYVARQDRQALDPVSLPITRSARGITERRQGGLFGVFRDASPEGFGLALLEQLMGRTLDDAMQRLEWSEGDAVGAIEVCDDIDSKVTFVAPDSAELLSLLKSLPQERPSSQAAREIKGLHGTSLGGERPKLTVQHRGQMWIAKLQERADPPHMPLREFLAMTLARRCGVNAAEVELAQAGDREVLFVRRFDRHLNAQGKPCRRLYASAHTVLRLDAHTRGERQRSYVALAQELRRWGGAQGTATIEQSRELWRRMAFNAIVGNGDDHPRNHGLLHGPQGWTLSEAFDIAPYITFSGTLAMAITRDGQSIATRNNLLATCEHFGYERAEAADHIEQCQDIIAQEWPRLQVDVGASASTVPFPAMTWLDG